MCRWIATILLSRFPQVLPLPIQARGYVSKQGKALKAEPLGRVLTAFLAAYFPRYVDYGFTAGLEAQLDDVSGAENGIVSVVMVDPLRCDQSRKSYKILQIQSKP